MERLKKEQAEKKAREEEEAAKKKADEEAKKEKEAAAAAAQPETLKGRISRAFKMPPDWDTKTLETARQGVFLG